jgi:hypothetical protein
MSARTAPIPSRSEPQPKKTAKSSKTIRANKRKGQTERDASAPASAGDCLSHGESGAERDRLEPARLAFARMVTRLAGLHVGAFWDPDDPMLISLPGPAWLGAR